jgi:hypothetical protein
VDRIGSAADSASIASGDDTAQRRFFGTAIQSLPLRTVGLGTAGTAATGLATTTALDTGSASVAKDILEDTGNNRECYCCQQFPDVAVAAFDAVDTPAGLPDTARP